MTIASISALIIVGIFFAAPSIVIAQRPGSNATSSTTNATAVAKPVDDYNSPMGHLSAIRHIFDDPSLRVQHYCKPKMLCYILDPASMIYYIRISK